MHYFNKMKSEIESQKQIIEVLTDGLNDIRRYLNSDKFKGFENNFVNPDDIRMRIQEIISAAGSIE